MKIGFTIESQSAEIHVSIVSFNSFDDFDEMWEGTDEHQGGVTIKNPRLLGIAGSISYPANKPFGVGVSLCCTRYL